MQVDWAEPQPAGPTISKSKDAQEAKKKVVPTRPPEPEVRMEQGSSVQSDLKKMGRANTLASIPPESKGLRQFTSQALGWGDSDVVALEGESAKVRIEAEIKRLQEKEASAQAELILLQIALERQGVLPKRLVGDNGEVLSGVMEVDPSGGYRVQTTSVARERVNLDAGAAIAFVSQGSPERRELKAFAQGKDIFISETAMAEFRGALKVGGPLETARAQRLLARLSIVPDAASPAAAALQVTKKVGANDKVVFGTGDRMGAITMTSDAKFIKGAAAQGVTFRTFVHRPVPLTRR